MKIKYYEAKTLFNGAVIGKEGKFIAVPDKFKGFKIIVRYEGQEMTIDKWLNADGFRKFPDKFGRKDDLGNTLQYTLGYFKWNPDHKDEHIDTTQAMSKMVGTPEWEKLRAKFHPNE